MVQGSSKQLDQMSAFQVVGQLQYSRLLSFMRHMVQGNGKMWRSVMTGWEREIKMEDSVSPWDQQCPEVCGHIPSCYTCSGFYPQGINQLLLYFLVDFCAAPRESW